MFPFWRVAGCVLYCVGSVGCLALLPSVGVPPGLVCVYAWLCVDPLWDVLGADRADVVWQHATFLPTGGKAAAVMVWAYCNSCVGETLAGAAGWLVSAEAGIVQWMEDSGGVQVMG